MTANKPMTGEQLDELMTVAVNMQRDSEKQGDRPTAMFAYAVQVAVLELRKVRDDAAADSWNACRAAMLQGAEQQSRQQNIPENIPATQFNPVADLYGLTSPTGSETSFTFDAVEARDFIDGGWSCQEYVELERFQEAVIGNSPVIPDGWVACSERLPEIGIKVLCFPINDEPIHATYNGQVWLQDISWSTSYEPIDNVISCNVFHWMPLPAAPQQEAK